MAEPRRLRAWPGILLGAVFLAALLALAHEWTTAPYIGRFLYNYYFLSLIDGRLNVPAQVAGLEGFYDAEGRAFLYHGLGPVATRVLAWPFVDLTQTDMRAPTIWLFATLGSASFYAVALRVLSPVWPDAGSRGLAGLVWILFWVLAPGLILASNGAFFHEGLSFAFAMAGLGVFCLWRLIDSGFQAWPWLVGLALAGALAVHGRPHVALGLYAVSVVASLMLLWRLRGRGLLPAALAMLLLSTSGLGYLQMNKLRFGAATEITGTVSDEGARTVYGFLYWGWEPPDHPRFKSQETHGDFMVGRILPNLMLYSASMGGEGSIALYRRATAEMGHIRIEPPVFGVALLWLPWVILAAVGLIRRGVPRAFFWLGLLSVLPGALVMLSYTTITMRYRVELWPVLFVLGIAGLAGFLALTAGDTEGRRRLIRSLWVAALAGVGVSAFNAYIYMDVLNWDWGTALWTYEDCARMVRAHDGLGPDKVPEICVLNLPGA